MSTRINLQNTPAPSNIQHQTVHFQSGDAQLAGLLFTPTDTDGPFPTIIVTGAWTTVKEQMAGTYARLLAAHGFATLAFDFTGWGQSTGTPRYMEDPQQKIKDIHAAVDALAQHPDVDPNNITGLGICASSGYMAAAVADHPKMRALMLVAPWLHDQQLVYAIYGGADTVKSLIELGQNANHQTINAASTTDEQSLMFQAPYYTEPDRGLIDEYDNKFNLSSWEPWLTFDAQIIAERLQKPTLIVCSEAAALPAGAHAFAARSTATVQSIWLDDINQFDFYDRADVIDTAIGHIIDHLQEVSS